MWTTGVKTALIVVCAFFVFQQITGINVPLYYGPKLLGPLFQAGSSKVAATMAGVEVTAIIAAVNVIATYFAFRWIDRIGRRKLAMGGYAGMCAAALISAPGLLLLSGLPRIILVMIALNAFVASFAIGVGGTGWLIQGEVFPTGVRGQAAAVGASVDWIANFALIEVFPTWQTGIGLGWIMACFAALCLLAIAFVHRFLPETKNRLRRGDHPAVREAGGLWGWPASRGATGARRRRSLRLRASLRAARQPEAVSLGPPPWATRRPATASVIH